MNPIKPESSGLNLSQAMAMIAPESPTDTPRAIVDVAILARGASNCPIPRGARLSRAGTELFRLAVRAVCKRETHH